MSLARSLTSRMRARFEENAHTGQTPNRAYSTKAASSRPHDKNIDRRLISLPVELLSTSNAQAYEAPDIKNLVEPKQAPRSPAHSPLQPLSPSTRSPLSPISEHQLSPQASMSSASSTRSWEDGLTSPALTSASSVTSHDPSREPSPANCDPSPMSKSFFFDKDEETKEKQAKVTVTEIQPETPKDEPTKELGKEDTDEKDSQADKTPAVPRRSAMHTKETHQHLARQRSLSRQASPRQSADQPAKPTEITTETKTESLKSPPQLPPVSRISTDLLSSSKSALDHPFGAELAKVNELVEELGARDVAIVDEETQYLIDNGFRCFGATDYILEIQPLFYRAFGEPALPVIAEWI
jgi:hypothetical protein